MASALGRVLIIGTDLAEMDTRRAVLEHFWPIETRTVDTWAQEKLNADLVVVCDSLPEAERQDWVARVRLRAPHILLVRLNGYDSGPHAGADATVDERHGPGALVSTIYELLTERALPSRGWPIPGAPPRLH